LSGAAAQIFVFGAREQYILRILVSGAKGFVGRFLVSYFSKKQWEIVPLAHEMVSPDEIRWRTPNGLTLEDFDAAIHLAGEPLGFGRWSEAKKRKILSSRSLGTLEISRALAYLRRPPPVFISASAVGFYGDRGEELLHEGSAPGKGFLAHVCKEWEEGSRPIASRGARAVQARFGMVLGEGGALRKMAPFYRMGFGGRLGTGKQWVSWVALADLALAIDHILRTETLHGPVNIVSPHAVRQEELCRTLAAVLHRPSFSPLPTWLLRLRFGDFADEVLLASAHAVPQKLLATGFHFKYPDLKDALLTILGR
jgi:uncharacterized protein